MDHGAAAAVVVAVVAVAVAVAVAVVVVVVVVVAAAAVVVVVVLVVGLPSRGLKTAVIHLLLTRFPRHPHLRDPYLLFAEYAVFD